MEVVVVESKLWIELNQRLNSVESLLIEYHKKQDAKPTYLIDWLPLQKAYDILGINKHKWIRHYKTLFRIRKYKRETWIYKPDVETWLMKNSFKIGHE
jgi:hypothetical protein